MTSKTLKEPVKSSEEIYKFVYEKLVEQGGPSLDDRDNCMYRSPNGRKCAVGHLIPDDQYQQSIETNSVGKLIKDGILKFDCETKLLKSLQLCHDATRSTAAQQTWSAYFHERYKQIGEDYGFDTSFIIDTTRSA